MPEKLPICAGREVAGQLAAIAEGAITSVHTDFGGTTLVLQHYGATGAVRLDATPRPDGHWVLDDEVLATVGSAAAAGHEPVVTLDPAIPAVEVSLSDEDGFTSPLREAPVPDLEGVAAMRRELPAAAPDLGPVGEHAAGGHHPAVEVAASRRGLTLRSVPRHGDDREHPAARLELPGRRWAERRFLVEATGLLAAYAMTEDLGTRWLAVGETDDGPVLGIGAGPLVVALRQRWQTSDLQF